MLTARGLGIHQWDMQLKDMRTFLQVGALIIPEARQTDAAYHS